MTNQTMENCEVLAQLFATPTKQFHNCHLHQLNVTDLLRSSVRVEISHKAPPKAG